MRYSSVKFVGEEKKSGNRKNDTQLIDSTQYLAIARRTANRLKHKYPWIPSDDLYSYALFGLVKADVTYKPDRHVPFAAYAGSKSLFAAVDEMRRDGIFHRRNRKPRPDVVSLEQAAVGESDGWRQLCGGGVAEKTIERLEAREVCAAMLRKLNHEDRKLMLLRYVEDMTFREIGQVLNVSESTICLRHRALMKMFRSQADKLRRNEAQMCKTTERKQ